MPDLGKYTEYVLLSYGLSIALLLVLLALTLRRGIKARAELRQMEQETAHNAKD